MSEITVFRCATASEFLQSNVRLVQPERADGRRSQGFQDGFFDRVRRAPITLVAVAALQRSRQ